MQGFVHFYCKKYSWPETRTGGLIDPLGGWRCKMRKGLKI